MSPHFVTFTAQGRQSYGLHTGSGVIDLGPGNPQLPSLRDVITAGALKEVFLQGAGRADDYSLDQVTLEMPIPNPGKILCVGVNFPDRNAEYKDGSAQPQYMSLFPRFASSFTGHDRPLIRPPENHTLDYEGEVAVVIGKPGRRIKAQDAYDHIAALTLCNEGTIRDWVRHAKFNVTQGKNWDNSGAMGPWLVPFTNPAQLDGARIVTRVNGEVRQDDRLERMIFPVREQIAYISTFTTLQPGDIIVTGTPTGAGARFDPPRYLAPGDVVDVTVEGIGTLRNTVQDEAI
ncbi:fumarylacetoacetate hydrolase family protein [Tropicibacter oceani]|uniref:Fumarylacetoacetate hydrolase family protein n=1 Tax=Tropicibacter oceani TaxID=3058420 RepID=A0ABY8QPC1_9RHOB|nr:fumarylacetoacetate hydrolase family protein [Tropicibacter oceani]WGW05881.1 fumarylacetoacetate hydrolase family protein [Tropicibacter oceani]